MNISMPEEMYDFVVTQVSERFHYSVSDYLRSLIRQDQVRCARDTVLRFEDIRLRPVNEVMEEIELDD